VSDWKPHRRPFWSGPAGIVTDVVLVLAVLALGYAAVVSRPGDGAAAADDAATATVEAPATATATQATASAPTAGGIRAPLADIAYERGRCYSWGQQDALETGAHEVHCVQPHLFEVIDQRTLPTDEYPAGIRYPSDEEWASIADEYCSAPVAEFLGYELDPDGLFVHGFLQPVPDSWSRGGRRIACGLHQRPLPADAAPGLLPAFSGKVKGADQSLVYPAGACLAETAAGVRGTVGCEQPHEAVAVGTITLPPGPSHDPPTDAQFDALAAPRCMDLARATLGAGFRDSPTVRTGWLRISPASWRAGSHTFTCTVDYRTAAGELRSETGPPTAAALAASGADGM